MLRFESLELIGFKSFVDKTRVVFHDQITSVVGPNGCGKSNLADAIGWVLGTQTARSLRSEKMEDVIFSGTRRKKSSGFAQVTLTLKSSDETPLMLKGKEFSGEALEITRKLYRSGESIYWVNQHRCRLKDIHELMEEAGLGFSSYALIAQGRIDSFLSAKPLERRGVLEEAAGISGYRSRRRSAELKLKMAQQNLFRLNDIISEIERQVRTLKRQAAKAQRYQKLKEEFGVLETKTFTLEARQLASRLEVAEQQSKELRIKKQANGEELAVREKEHIIRLKKKDKLEAALSHLRQRHSDSQVERDRSENLLRYHEEQREMIEGQREAHLTEQKMTAQSLEKILKELREFEEEQQGLEVQEKQVEQVLEEQENCVKRYRKRVSEGEERLQHLRTRFVRLSAQTTSLRNARMDIEQYLKVFISERKRLETEHLQIGLALRRSRTRIEEKKQLIEQKQEEMGSLNRTLRQQEMEKRRLEEQLEALGAQSSELQNRLIGHRERIHSLAEIQLSHSQYSEGVREFLNHLSRSGNIRPKGTLADYVETRPEYERLVEEFLREELEYVLVPSLAEAIQGVMELKALRTGKCTFLSLSFPNGLGKSEGRLDHGEGVHGTLADLLEMKPEVEDAFRRALPHRAGALVVSDLDRAFQLARECPEETFVTLQGETLTPRGLLSASAMTPSQLGLLSLKRQKRELEKVIGELQKSRSLLEKRRHRCRAQLESIVGSCTRDQNALYDLEKRIIGFTHELEQWRREEQRQGESLRVLDKELARVEREQDGEEVKMQQLEEELAGKIEIQLEVKQRLPKTQQHVEQLKEEFGRAQTQLHCISSDQKVMRERRRSLDQTVQRVEEQRKGLESRCKETQRARKHNQDRLQQSAAELQTLRSNLDCFRQQTAELGVSVEQRQQVYGGWKEGFPDLETTLTQLRDQGMKLQEGVAQIDVERARLETRLENLQARCSEQLGLTLDEATAEVDLLGETSTEILQSYDELRSRLHQFGAINMTALEEYQRNEERFDFLTRQRGDVEQSIADTSRAIQEINRRSRQRFQETFEEINVQFKEIFQKLFEGGECGLRLLGEEDLLERGIDIYAQPPGKKLQSIMLLSGGEKTLTVLALLVALFAYRPSQFCVLDEVDAALDDANIARYTSLLKQLCRDQQIIIITHNKRTMAIADVLYGVTMEEAGISRVVSVRF